MGFAFSCKVSSQALLISRSHPCPMVSPSVLLLVVLPLLAETRYLARRNFREEGRISVDSQRILDDRWLYRGEVYSWASQHLLTGGPMGEGYTSGLLSTSGGSMGEGYTSGLLSTSGGSMEKGYTVGLLSTSLHHG